MYAFLAFPALALVALAKAHRSTTRVIPDRYPDLDASEIFGNLRKMSKVVNSLYVADPDNREEFDSLKCLWGENRLPVTILLWKTVAEQLISRIVPTMQRGNATGLLSLYRQQLELVDHLIDISIKTTVSEEFEGSKIWKAQQSRAGTS